MKKIFFVFLLVGSVAAAEVIEKIVAVVNDEIITLSDINKYRSQLKKGKFLDETVLANKDKLLKDEDALIKHLIDEKIIDSAVKQMGLAMTVEKVEQEIESIARRNKISTGDLRSEIKKEGVSFSEYQNFVKQRLERQALIERAVTSKIKITDEEVQAYYLTKHKGPNAESYEYTLAHILISDKSGPDAAKKKTDDLEKRLRNGEGFESLAAQFSEDPNFTAGGFLGTFKSGEFLSELEAGVKNIPIGGLSAPVKTKLGYHILKVLNKKIISDPKFEAQKENIRNLLYKDAFSNQFNFWLEQERASAFVKINK